MEVNSIREATDILIDTWLDLRVGYTSGVFDLFHEGHANYLNKCLELCDILIVGVDSDLKVKFNKGLGRPIDDIGKRISNVQLLSIFCFEKKEGSINYIRLLRPHYYFFSEGKVLDEEKNCLISKVERFIGFFEISYTVGISTSSLIRNLLPESGKST
ncbi:adenylyltransferase/cytidyltransferase family protein [Pseudomonas sp. R4-34-07]|uniref:adenylyltransferase/cytidyltransferase family protein n=1 Tax=Pseudomonas sp. R4-34-07 TaxID=658642 RepID=UPI000F578EB2|nr:adenylyltransferase/cytidyltransferase family protein [Pseudomonas sp. R4-34-07]